MSASSQKLASGKILFSVEDAVGTITFNQPEKHNAMSVEMWTGLEQILDVWEKDDAVHAVVLTGAGDKAFMSGADISEFAERRSNDEQQRGYEQAISGGRARLVAFPKPIIARIQGYCLGGGLAMAIQADIRIASEDSQFGIPAARLGLGYGFHPIRRLVSLIGPAHAAMMLYTGARIQASEAARIGLVNRVVKKEDLAGAVSEVARAIAHNAPLSIRANKLVIEQVLRDPEERDMEALKQANIACFNSQDYREGRTAFLEKRTPRFRGL